MDSLRLSPRAVALGSLVVVLPLALLVTAFLGGHLPPVLPQVVAATAGVGGLVAVGWVYRRRRAGAVRAEFQFQGLMDATPDPILITDRRGQILLANEHAERLFGYTRKELLGRAIDSLVTQQTAPGREPSSDIPTSTWDLGPSVPGYVGRTKSTRHLDLDVRFSSLEVPGQFLIVNLIRDVSEERRRERRRAARAAVRRILVEGADLDTTAPLLVTAIGQALRWVRVDFWLAEGAGKPLTCRASWAADSSSATAAGTRSFAPEDGLAARARREAKVVSSGGHGEVAVPVVVGESIQAVLECHGVAHEVGDDFLDTLGTIGTQIGQYVQRRRDAAAMLVAEEQLRHSQKMEAVGRLAAGIAHDFNNMVAVVSMSCALLKRDEPLSPSAREVVGQIQLASHRAAALTRQLLTFSRKQPAAPTVVDLNPVVDGVASMIRQLLGSRVELRTETAAEPLPVRVDQGHMDQVLMNLAVNARDAMPEGGVLTIATDRVEVDERTSPATAGLKAGRYARLTVSDTGVGMDEEVQAHIFDPFFTTKEAGKGTGLGMSIVYGIVRQSGGHITVASQPGQGATFLIYLPAAE